MLSHEKEMDRNVSEETHTQLKRLIFTLMTDACDTCRYLQE